MSNIGIGSIFFTSSIDLKGYLADLRKAEDLAAKRKPIVIATEISLTQFQKQLAKIERESQRGGVASAGAWVSGFERGLKINFVPLGLSKLVTEAARSGTRSGQAYSENFEKIVARVNPNFNISTRLAQQAGKRAGEDFGNSIGQAARSRVQSSSGTIFGAILNGTASQGRTIGSSLGTSIVNSVTQSVRGGSGSIFGSVTRQAATTATAAGRTLGTGIVGSAGATVGTGASIFGGLIGSAVSIGTTLGRGITSGVAGAISVGGGIISNAFTGIVAGVSSSITSAIGSGIRNSLEFIKDSYIGVLKAGFREAFSDAKKAAELDLISAQSGRLAYENIPASQRAGMSPEQFQRDFKKSALDAGSDAGLELSNRQALQIGSQLSRMGFGRLAASSIKPIGRLSSVLGEDPNKTAEYVGSSAAPFNLKTEADMNRFVNQMGVAATLTRATIEDLNTSLKYYRENVSGTEGSDEVLRLLSRLGAVGITGSTGSIVAGQISQRKVAIGNVVGVSAKQLANLNTSESIDVLLAAYKKRLKELGEVTVDALNFTNSFKKSTGERGASILKLLSEDDASRERINQRFDKIAKGQDDLKSQADALVKRASKQFDVLASSFETLQSGRIGEASLPVFAGFARMATTAIGEIIKIKDWEPLIKAGEKFYALILKITDEVAKNSKVFQPIVEFVSKVIRDITGTVNELTQQLGTERGVSALVNRIVGGLEIAYGIFRGITRGLLTLVGGESTIGDFFDPKKAEDFRISAVKTGKTIEDGIVKAAFVLRDLFASVPAILQTWVPMLTGITKLVVGIGETWNKVVSRTKDVINALPKTTDQDGNKRNSFDSLGYYINQLTNAGKREKPQGYSEGYKAAQVRVNTPDGQTTTGQQIVDTATTFAKNGGLFGVARLTDQFPKLMDSVGRFVAEMMPGLLQTAGLLASIGGKVLSIFGSVTRVVLDVSRPILKILLPALNGVLAILDGILTGAVFASSQFANMIQTVSNSWMTLLNPAMDGLLIQVRDIQEFVQTLSIKLSDATGVIVEWIGDVINFENVKKFFNDIDQASINFFGGWSRGIDSAATATNNFFVNFWKGFTDTISNTATSIWTGITNAFSRIGAWLFGGAAQASEAPALQAGQSAGNAIATGVETGASNAGGSWMQLMTDSFFNSVKSIGGFFTGMFDSVRNGIAWIATQSIPFLQTAWKAYYDALTGFWLGVWNGIRSGIGWIASNSLPFLQKAATGMLSAVNDFWNKSWKFIRDSIAWLVTNSLPFLQKAATSMLSAVNDFWNRSWKFIRDGIAWLANQSLPFLQNAFSGVFNFVSNTWNGVFKGIRDAIAWIGNNSLKWLQDRFGGVFRFLQDRLGDLQKLFGGGGNNGGGQQQATKGTASEADQYVAGVLSILESPTRQGRIDVSQVLANRSKNNFSGYGTTLRDQAFAPGQFQPFFSKSQGGYGIGKNEITDRNSAIYALQKAGFSREQAVSAIDSYLADVRNPQMQQAAKSGVGGFAYFNGTSQAKYKQAGDFQRTSNDNFFGKFYGDNRDYSGGDLAKTFGTAAGNAAGAAIGKAVSQPGARMPVRVQVSNRNDPDGSAYGFDYGVWGSSADGTGDPVYSLVPGKVVEIKRNDAKYGMSGQRGFGNLVVVRTTDTTTGKQSDVQFAHLDSIDVKLGQLISQGQIIGKQGSTGSSTSPHVSIAIYAPNSNTGGAAQVSLGRKLEQSVDNQRYASGLRGGGGAPIQLPRGTGGIVDNAIDKLMSVGVGSGGAPQLGTFMRLTRTGKKDSKGLELLKLDLVDRATGRVLDSVMTNSGFADTQNFSKTASVTGTNGSRLPIPSGTFSIGDVVKSDKAGIGGSFIEIDGAGDNQKGRGLFGIHLDADRLSKPGSAGCVVVFDTADRAKVLDWVNGRNAPTTLKVDYSVPKVAVAKPVTIPASNVRVQVGSGTVKPLTNSIIPLPTASLDLAKPLTSTSTSTGTNTLARLSTLEETAIAGLSPKIQNLYRDLESQRVQLGLMQRETAQEQQLYTAARGQYLNELKLLPEALQRIQNQKTIGLTLPDLRTVAPGVANLPLTNPLSGSELIEQAQEQQKLNETLAEERKKLNDRQQQLIAGEVEFAKVRESEAAFLKGLSERERKIYEQIEAQRQAIDKMRSNTTEQAKLKARAVAVYEQNLSALDKSILTGGAAAKLRQFQEDRTKTNDNVLKARLDVEEQKRENAKAAADRALEERKQALNSVGKDAFDTLKTFLLQRGLNASDDDIVRILTRGEQIEQQRKALTPSSLGEGTRQVLFELGILNGGSYDASRSIPSLNLTNQLKPNNNTVDAGTLIRSLYNSRVADNQLSVYRQLYESGAMVSGFERFPNMTADQIRQNMTFSPPVSSSGGGGSGSSPKRVEVRFIEDGAGNQFVKREDFEKFSGTMTDYLNSPFMLDGLADSVVDRIRYDAVTRRRLGF